MTRKQAILDAINILSKDNKNKEIVTTLNDMLNEYPFSHWTKESIIDSIIQFAIEHNNILPQQKELTKSNKMPSSTAIESIFGYSSISSFYKDYFPNYKIINHNSPYKYNDREYFISIFRKNYEMIKNKYGLRVVSEKMYDKRRLKNTPLSKTIVKNCGLKSYNKLLIECGYIKESKPIECTVNVSYNTEESFNDLDCIIKTVETSLEM